MQYLDWKQMFKGRAAASKPWRDQPLAGGLISIAQDMCPLHHPPIIPGSRRRRGCANSLYLCSSSVPIFPEMLLAPSYAVAVTRWERAVSLMEHSTKTENRESQLQPDRKTTASAKRSSSVRVSTGTQSKYTTLKIRCLIITDFA